MAEPTLEVKDLKTYFYTRYGLTKAVDGVSFSANAGETLALLGESGCGKSVTCLSLIRLVPPPGRIVSGQVLFEGKDLLNATAAEMRNLRGKDISLVMQDPQTSLNPVFTIGDQVAEPLRIHRGLDRSTVWEEVKKMLRLVKIPSPEIQVRQYPHQLSGGMKQRTSIAMAFSCSPRLLLADEPTTALDVTTQAQILRLLRELQETSGMIIILVTHDFNIVAKTADQVAVMYAGRIVENARTKEIMDNPFHPYTAALRDCVPELGQQRKMLFSIPGQPPDLRNPPEGCAFAPRCDQVFELCRPEYPPTVEVGKNHTVSCWKYVDRTKR